MSDKRTTNQTKQKDESNDSVKSKIILFILKAQVSMKKRKFSSSEIENNSVLNPVTLVIHGKMLTKME